ncbi:MAG: JAB domain-containing protein [Eubacteriales bacterium]
MAKKDTTKIELNMDSKEAEVTIQELEPIKAETKVAKKPKKEPHPNAQHRQRVKKHFQKSGIQGFSEHRALELLLFFGIPQGDVADVARDLIRTFGDFPSVLKASHQELCKVKGMGDHSATLIKLVTAMQVYNGLKESESIVFVHNSQTAFEILSSYFLNAKVEKVFVLYLDAQKRQIGTRPAGEGSLLSVGFNFRQIATEALTLGAVRVYVAHNHVTGTLEPSAADWNATQRLLEALHPFEIYVEDHLIIGRQEAASMRQISQEKRFPLPWPR